MMYVSEPLDCASDMNSDLAGTVPPTLDQLSPVVITPEAPPSIRCLFRDPHLRLLLLIDLRGLGWSFSSSPPLSSQFNAPISPPLFNCIHFLENPSKYLSSRALRLLVCSSVGKVFPAQCTSSKAFGLPTWIFILPKKCTSKFSEPVNQAVGINSTVCYCTIP